jgi:hypothetical protein
VFARTFPDVHHPLLTVRRTEPSEQFTREIITRLRLTPLVRAFDAHDIHHSGFPVVQAESARPDSWKVEARKLRAFFTPPIFPAWFTILFRLQAALEAGGTRATKFINKLR